MNGTRTEEEMTRRIDASRSSLTRASTLAWHLSAAPVRSLSARSRPVIQGLQKEALTMECLHCKGRMVRATAPFSIDRKGYHIVWEAIPAWVCTQCGEPFFEAAEVEAIQRSLAAVDRETAALVA
jgi:YgiT-type zinc finger domain-containing protein